MGLFSKKPVLPDYTGMPVEERMKDPAWYDTVSRVPGFSDEDNRDQRRQRSHHERR